MAPDKKMPVVFVGHGSPMNAVGRNRAREGWAQMGMRIGKPQAILAVSAHWATPGLAVRTAPDNPQIYDMYGFPDELYQVKYAPAASPELARRALGLLGEDAVEDNSWGIDHGVWSVLSNMYPDVDVPVVMVSTALDASPDQLVEAGAALAPLRDEGVLIVASGNVVHNLGRVAWERDDGFEWADKFDGAIRDAILSGDVRVPVRYEELDNARLAVPTVDHYFPLLVALGAVSGDDEATVFNEYRELGSMSMTSYLWEPRRSASEG